MASHSATYTSGSVFGHLSNLALTSAIGMFAIMIVDLVDMYFISILGQPSLAAAVGFAGLGLFLGASVCIGISIAVSTLVSQSLGEKSEQRARRYAIHGFIYSLVWTIPVTGLTLIYARELLMLIGAEGETLDLAVQYFRIVGASLPILGIAFIATSLLRSVGDARLSMWSTVVGGAVNAVLDPFFIFALEMQLKGAAIASVISRFSVAAIALYGILKKHELIVAPHWREFFQDVHALNKLAMPSILTNLSAPVSAAYATAQMAQFGTDAVAASSVIGRLTPVAFCGIYALSGSVGPIASQNFGAQQYGRVTETLKASAKFIMLYVIPVTVIMILLQDSLAVWFSLDAQATELLTFYTTFIVGSYLLFSLQLAANPIFTALHHPAFATISNITRDLLLAVPLIFLFSLLFGAKGVLAGQALANAIAGILAFSAAMWMAKRVERGQDIDFRWSKFKLHHHYHVPAGVQHRGH